MFYLIFILTGCLPYWKQGLTQFLHGCFLHKRLCISVQLAVNIFFCYSARFDLFSNGWLISFILQSKHWFNQGNIFLFLTYQITLYLNKQKYWFGWYWSVQIDSNLGPSYYRFEQVNQWKYSGTWAHKISIRLYNYKRPWKTSSFPINAHSCSLLWPNFWLKALLTNKLYKAYEDAWVTTTELKVF